MSAGRRRDERGAAVVVAVGLVAVLVFVTAVCMAVVALVLAHRKAQVAADLAALAGASALQGGADPCAAAERIAVRQDARLTGCEVDGSDVVVATGVRVGVRLGGAELPARARAGPVGLGPDP